VNQRNLEVILKKAAVDEAFRENLVRSRSGALEGHELKLDDSEKALLDSVPEEQLRQMIRLTPVNDRERGLLGRAVLTAGVVTAVALGVMITVGSPLIGSLGSRPERIATRTHLDHVRSALLEFYVDVGRWPIPGTPPFSHEDVERANERFLGLTPATNILINPDIDVADLFPLEEPPEARRKFLRRWKGPYLDGDPKDFMQGAPGGRIRMIVHDNTLFLHHPGIDNINEEIGSITERFYEGDDHLLKVVPLKPRTP
jgi:hypothetical protein